MPVTLTRRTGIAALAALTLSVGTSACDSSQDSAADESTTADA